MARRKTDIQSTAWGFLSRDEALRQDRHFFVDYEDEVGDYGVFGDRSGFMYWYGPEREANAYAKRLESLKGSSRDVENRPHVHQLGHGFIALTLGPKWDLRDVAGYSIARGIAPSPRDTEREVKNALHRYFALSGPDRDPERRRAQPTRQQAEFIHEKIPVLIDEGYPQRQAIAIAYSMAGVPPLPRPSRDRLTTEERREIPTRLFALPERRALPIEDSAHIRNAAARLEQMRIRGTVSPAEYREAKARIQQAERANGIGPKRRRVTDSRSRSRKSSATRGGSGKSAACGGLGASEGVRPKRAR